jgi:Ca-activated chloride channel family protein
MWSGKLLVYSTYRTILINQAQPVHAVLKLTAEKRASNRKSALAFCAVLDRSGSMNGNPLAYAKKACETVARHLTKDDWFSLVAFDNEAQVIFPLQKITSRDDLVARIRAMETRGSTNLTGGWMLGRDELKKAPADRRNHLGSGAPVNDSIRGGSRPSPQAILG